MRATPVMTKRLVRGQLIFCVGCCCGRTERGLPEVPVERLKSVWRAEKLNRTIQLTISGCLGPCDVANVALVLTPGGSQWFGRLAGSTCYEAFITWARTCQAAGALRPLPDLLEGYRMERFPPAVGADDGHWSQPLGVAP
jgi:hypothetical protein